MQHLHSAALDNATVNSAKSKSATSIGETLKKCNVNSEIRKTATLIDATLNRAT